MKILILGDRCTDVFYYGSVDRICPEAPVPVLKTYRSIKNPGMVGNVYENFTSINKRFFKSKFDVTLMSNNNEIYKTRYVDEKSNQMLLRVDEHDYSTERFDINEIGHMEYDAIIVSDYDKGFLNEETLSSIPKLTKYSFIDTKKQFDDWIIEYTYIKINEKEWKETCDWKGIDTVRDKCIVTLGSDGAKIGDRYVSIQNPVEVRDLSGAGDTFMSAFTSWFLNRVEDSEYYDELVDSSIRFGNQMASKVVSQQGVTTP